MKIRAVSDPVERTRHCRDLTARLPGWFGIPESNDHYAEGIAALETYGAFDAAGGCLGLIALRPHFDRVLEIWWMAVDPDRHGGGIGKALMAQARDVALREGRRELIVMTLSPESEDAGYAATRAFYRAQGFCPLIALEHGPDEDPLMWMMSQL